MNCGYCQKKIVEALAAGAVPQPPDVSAHRHACLACREFYEKEAKLFRSMEAGLQWMVNQEVPPSLVPSVRARPEHLALVHRPWIPSWSFVAIPLAVAAVLAFGVGHSLDRQGIRFHSPDNRTKGSPNVVAREPALGAPLESTAALPSRPHRSMSALVAAAGASDAVPQVVIPAEERQGFARLVNDLPNQREVALALAQPVSVSPDAPVEIALLQIEQVEVKPLEGTPAE